MTVAKGCEWKAASQSDWIQVNDSQLHSGDGSIGFSVAPSQESEPRSGALTIAKQTVSISQGSCQLHVSPATFDFSENGGTQNLTVDAQDGCGWTASGVPSWVSLQPVSGTGAATIHVHAEAQTDTSHRDVTIHVGSETVIVRQAPQSCVVRASVSPLDFPLVGGSGVVRVETGAACAWAIDTHAPWLRAADPTNGVGSATVRVVALPNPDSGSRRTTLQIGTASLTLTQAGQTACSYRLTPHSRAVTSPEDPFQILVPNVGEISWVDVSTGEGCGWTATASTPWLSVYDGANRTASGRLNYEVRRSSAPSGSTAREGVIEFRWLAPTAGQNLHISQTGDCNIKLVNADNREAGFVDSLTFDARGGSVHLFVLVDLPPSICAWTLETEDRWYPVTFPHGMVEPGDGDINLTIPPNPSPQTRTGLILVGEKPLRITQTGK